MKVHVFGNSPSPAVAIYCLRHAALEGEEKFGQDARQFVEQDFYMDDGLNGLTASTSMFKMIKGLTLGVDYYQ